MRVCQNEHTLMIIYFQALCLPLSQPEKKLSDSILNLSYSDTPPLTCKSRRYVFRR